MIGRNGERGSRISALAARHDDDDDEIKYFSLLSFSVYDLNFFSKNVKYFLLTLEDNLL